MWVKIDDAMPHHVKLVSAGPQAFALDVAAICYASRYDTQGFIADASLPAILPGLAQAKRHANRLVDMGRWIRDDARHGYLIHDYGQYQMTSEEKLEKSKEMSQKGVLANHRRWHEDRGIVSPGCPHCPSEESQSYPARDAVGIPWGSPKPIPEVDVDLDLGLRDIGVGRFSNVPDADVTNGDEENRISKAERHRLAHVVQGKRDPENCDLCAAGQAAI